MCPGDSAPSAPDGSRIVTSSFDKTARIWDGRERQGKGPGACTAIEDAVLSVASAPTGRASFHGGQETMTARIVGRPSAKEIGGL